MNELQIIEQREVLGQDFKIYGTFEKPLFLAKDVAEWIGYEVSNVSKMVKNIDADEKIITRINNTSATFLTEDGLYEVLMQSRKPIAKKFKKEVKKILKELRLNGYYISNNNINNLEEMKVKAQLERAEAMKLNAKTRMFNSLMKSVNGKKLSPIAVEVFGLKAIEEITGVDTGQYLPQTPKTYTATDIGEMLGVSCQKIGGLAIKHNLKTKENGIWVMDKSKYSSKEVSTFRYYENAINIFRELLA